MNDMYSILRVENPPEFWTPKPYEIGGVSYSEDPRTTKSTLADLAKEAFSFYDGVSEREEGALSIAGGSRFQRDELHQFAAEFTELNPDATVTIREEWTGDEGPDITTKVYSNGAVLEDEGTFYDELPNNLPQLLANVRALYTDSKHNHGPFGCEACMLTEAARALVGALDPEGTPQ